MRTILKTAAVVLAMAYASTLFAQATPKLAHVSTQDLAIRVFEHVGYAEKLEKFEKEIQETYEQMDVEYRHKKNELEKKGEEMTESLRMVREKEINDIEQRMAEFVKIAEQEIEQLKISLMEPAKEKVNQTIKQIAEEQGLTYVFDAQSISYKASNTQDITKQVADKLGLTNDIAVIKRDFWWKKFFVEEYKFNLTYHPYFYHYGIR